MRNIHAAEPIYNLRYSSQLSHGTLSGHAAVNISVLRYSDVTPRCVFGRFASDEKRLQAHIISHRYTDIDNSSHACTICSRQFKLRFSLKNHMFKVGG